MLLATPRWLRLVCALAAGVWLSACFTVYGAFRARPPEQRTPPAELNHCLESLGFVDVSSASPQLAYVVQDLRFASIWMTSPSIPHCRVIVQALRTEWLVQFIPEHSDVAEVFSDAFAACTALHAPGTITRIDTRLSF